MPRLMLTFFGSFTAALDDRPLTRFRSVNNQGLLAYLALHPRKELSRELLAALFWPDESEKTARHNLRQALYHLRQIVDAGDDGGDPFLLVTRQTARFNPTSDYRLDVQDFLSAVEANDLAAAVAHYDDELLPGFTVDSLPFEEWLRQERESLHHLALEAMTERAGDLLQSGELDQAQALARRQLQLEPWRERAYRQLMRAQALAGDRTTALNTFEGCRSILWEELGVKPEAETVALVEDIRAGRLAAQYAQETIKPPLRIRHNLPANTAPLIGREDQITRLSAAISQDKQRLLSIVAPGGMGKTRLALAVGTSLLSQFPEGVYFVDLAPLDEPAEIIPAIAAALAYRAPDPSRSLKPQLLETLSRQNMLLILDNFEHLLSGVRLVDEILRSCPGLAILVTSRQRLNLTTENRYELGGLTVPESPRVDNPEAYTAVQLFIEAARRTRDDFTLTPTNSAAVVQICHLVQGMPLGLLLAAAWSELLTPAEIAAEIAGGLDFLTADLTDLPVRQRSMMAVFEGTWSLMSPDEQAVLARLSVFRGGFTREAAETVAGANLRVLLALVSKSLLQRQPEDGRFAMHELLRQYAASQRKLLDPQDRALLAHCHYYAALVRKELRRALHFLPLLLPRDHAADRENLNRAWDFALQAGLAGEIYDLVRGIYYFSISQGIQPDYIPQEAIRTLRHRGIPENQDVILLLRRVELNGVATNLPKKEAKKVALEFLQLVEKSDDLSLRFWSYDLMHEITFDEPGEIDWAEKAKLVAVAMDDEDLVQAKESGQLWYAVVHDQQDEKTKDQLEALLAYFQPRFPESFATYGTLLSLGNLHTALGQNDQAIHYGTWALNIAKSWQDLLWISIAVNGLAETYEQMELPKEAAWQFIDGLDWHLAVGQDWQTIGYLMGMGLDINSYHKDWTIPVEVLSMVYHHPDTSSYNKDRIELARSQIEGVIGIETYKAAWERGKSWDMETAVAQMRQAVLALSENTALEE